MENDYNSEEGLSFLSYMGIRLSPEEEQVFRVKWESYYKSAQPFKKDSTHRAILTLEDLTTGIGILTREPMKLLEREFVFESSFMEKLWSLMESGVSLREIMQKKLGK